jgi:hypothetical protein
MTTEREQPETGNFESKPRLNADYDPIIARTHKIVNEHLERLFADMVKTATGRLVSLDGKTQGYDEQGDYKKQALERESFRYLLSDVNELTSNFIVNVNKQLRPGRENSGLSARQELSLVSHEEMEEMVAITAMNANAVNEFGEAISDLGERINYLEIKNAPIFSRDAISPKGICEAYQKTLNQLDVGTVVNLALLKLFDDEVNLKLKGLYDRLNQVFIDADIMPEIDHALNSDESPSGELDNGQYDKAYDVQEEENRLSADGTETSNERQVDRSHFVSRSQAELNDIVSQFTQGDINLSADTLNMPEARLPESFYKDPAQQNLGSQHYYQRRDVVQSLNRLQQRLMEQGSDTQLNNAEQIKKSLMEDIDGRNVDGTAKEVSVLDERNIDFVGMLFNAIADDRNISKVVGKLVSQLHIPVIKVALDDEKLFQDRMHPTRKVLNLIPRAGKGVTDTHDRLYNKIENVVIDILAEHDVDIDSFYNAVDALHKIIHHEEKSAAVVEKEEKRNVIKAHARKVVVAELRKYTIGKTIPKNVQPLILKHWSTLMLNRYINHGNESELWSQASMLCRLVIDALQPVKDKKQWQFLENHYCALVEAIHDELYETQQDKPDIDLQIEILNNTFNKMLFKYGKKFKKDDEDEAETETDTEVESETEKAAEAPIDHVAQKEIAAYEAAMAKIRNEEESVVEKVARLPTYVKAGTWFEIYNGKNAPLRRLKMSVILLETAEIVFVDHKGVKGMAKDAGVFAEELASNKSRILADHSTFDDALGKVMSMMAA